MKVQNVFSTGLNYPQKNSSFGAKMVSKPGDDFSTLIDYASQDDKTTKELMVALKMLDHKNRDAVLGYSTSNDGEIYIENLRNGQRVTKINDYNSINMRDNFKSFLKFASPFDEQHQRLLGQGMNRQQAEEFKDAASLEVYDYLKKNPINKEIKEIQKQIDVLEQQKSEKTKELIRSLIITA
ncbi:unknown [Clostridium sp. CAG:306]|nr:unknown [Clostridium sp. CAG:306]